MHSSLTDNKWLPMEMGGMHSDDLFWDEKRRNLVLVGLIVSLFTSYEDQY